MSDSLTSFVVKYSAIGPNGDWTTSATLPASTTSFNDGTLVNPQLWYQLTQVTANGVNVPYVVASLVHIPQGQVTAAADPNDSTTLIFTWTVPSPLPAPIGWFELSGKFQNDPEDFSLFFGAYDADVRTGTAPVIPTDDFNNPYTYRLVGFIPR